METIDVRTPRKYVGSPRRAAVKLGAAAARQRGVPPGTRIRVRLRRPVEVAEGRGVALVPYFAETVYT